MRLLENIVKKFSKDKIYSIYFALKDEEFKTPVNQRVIFPSEKLDLGLMGTNLVELREILFELRNMDVIKIVDEQKSYLRHSDLPDLYLLEILHPEFDSFEDKILNMYDEPTKIEYFESTRTNNKSTKPSGIAKLEYYQDDCLIGFKGVQKKVKGKGRALLDLLTNNKNCPYSANEIAQKCNPKIINSYYHFKTNKDIYDTITYLKKKLKVKESEYFPIYKLGDNWIWVQK